MGITWSPETFAKRIPAGLIPGNVPQSIPIQPRYGELAWGEFQGYQLPPTLQSVIPPSEDYPHAITIDVLPNGHTVVIDKRPNAKVTSLRTFLYTGSIYERALHPSPLYPAHGFLSGIAHLDEHCHFLDVEGYEKNGWMKAVDALGARFNASTDHEVIQHELVFNQHLLPQMLTMHAQSVLRPVYKTRNIAQEKTNVINEMNERMNRPENKIHSKLWQLLFDRPDFQTLGTREDVVKTSVQDLQRFHQTFYTPTNMVTVISGNVNRNAVLPLMEKLFGSNPPRMNADPNAAIKLALRPGEIRYATVHDPTLTYSVVKLGFPSASRTQFKERMAMEFLAVLLGEGPTSLLESEIQNRQRLITGASVHTNPTKGTGSFEIALETDPGKEKKTLEETLKLITQLSYYMVTPEKLTEIRNRLIHQYKDAISNVEEASYMLGEESLYKSAPYCRNYIALANSITPMDLMAVAQKYLNPSTYAVVFGVPGNTRQLASQPLQEGPR